jgi:hypothetical protein
MREKPKSDRHVQSECARWPVSESVDDIERSLDLFERWREPFHQPQARFGRSDTPRRTMQQPHAELGFKAPHRLAESGGAKSNGAGRLAESPGSRDRQECIEIT